MGGEAGVVALQIDALPAPRSSLLMASTAAPVLPTYASSVVSHKSLVRPSPPQHHLHRDDHAPSGAESDRVIYFRKLVAEDVDQVRELHETWFPIRYNQSFYDGAVMGLWMETGGPLFAQLAVEVAPPALASSPSFNASASAYTQYMAPRPQREHILGAVTASTLPLTKVEDPDLIASDDDVHTHVMYILTLGSRTSVRRKGIASALLQECIDQAWRQPECGAVYLHVKADNVSALRFYEKNGFRNLRFLQSASSMGACLLGCGREDLIALVCRLWCADYYMIDGARHDAYLYIRYVNGAGPQTRWLEMITRPLLALFSIASSGWRKLIDGLSSDDHVNSDGTKKEDVHAAPASPPPLSTAKELTPSPCV